MTKESTNINTEIAEIAQRLETLSLLLRQREETASKEATLSPNNRVKILHRYRNRKGLIGTVPVQQTTLCFAYIKLDSSEELHRIHKDNLKKTSR